MDVNTHICARARAHTHTHTHTHTYTHIESTGQLDEVRFQRRPEDANVFDDLTLQGTLFQTDGAAYEKDLTQRVRAHRGTTKNGSNR